MEKFKAILSQEFVESKTLPYLECENCLKGGSQSHNEEGLVRYQCAYCEKKKRMLLS